MNKTVLAKFRNLCASCYKSNYLQLWITSDIQRIGLNGARKALGKWRGTSVLAVLVGDTRRKSNENPPQSFTFLGCGITWVKSALRLDSFMGQKHFPDKIVVETDSSLDPLFFF